MVRREAPGQRRCRSADTCAAGPRRWLTWARSFKNRFRPSRQHRGVALIFSSHSARPSLSQRLIERFGYFFATRLQLVVLALDRSHVSRTIVQTQPNPGALTRPRLQRLQFARASVVFRAAEPVGLWPRELVVPRPAEHDRTSLRHDTTRDVGLPRLTPLQLAFERLRRADTANRTDFGISARTAAVQRVPATHAAPVRPLAHAGHGSGRRALVGHVTETVARVLRTTRRIELPPAERTSHSFRKTARVLAQQPPETAMASAAMARRSDGQSQLEGRWRGQHDGPAINVNNLADQVMRQLDRRLTAWRERTGRA